MIIAEGAFFVPKRMIHQEKKLGGLFFLTNFEIGVSACVSFYPDLS